MKLLGIALLIACGKQADAPAPTPVGLPRLKVSVADKLVPMAKAFLAHRADGSFRVLVSDRDGSCGELATGMVHRSLGATTFLATIVTRLDPGGAPHYVIVEVEKDAGPIAPKKLDLAFVGTTAAAPGKPTPVQLELFEEDVGIGVAGGFDAEGCGEIDLPGAAAPRAAHPSTGVMWVATKKFPIQGAIRRGDTLVVSDLPVTCSPATLATGVRLQLALGKWTLDGARIPGAVIADAPKLAIAPGATGASPDGPTVQLALSGADKLGDFPVGLEGVVEALDCK